MTANAGRCSWCAIPMLMTFFGSAGAEAAKPDLSWLSAQQVPQERVTSGLEEIQGLPSAEAGEHGRLLTERAAGLAGEGRWTARLLAAAAFERAEDFAGARTSLQDVVQSAAGTPYAVSAEYRLTWLSTWPPESKPADKVINQIAKTDPNPAGWFLVSNHWTWSTRQAAAWRDLAGIRAAKPTYRLLASLRAKSPFPAPYAYLFILLITIVASKLLALPLLVRVARFSGKTREMQAELAEIQSNYAGDPLGQQAAMRAWYSRHGGSMLTGCGVVLVDLIFVILVLVFFADFRPQLAIDGARFLWVSDVNRFSLGLTVLTLGVLAVIAAVTQAAATGSPVSQYLGGGILSHLIILAIAWIWHWPAYVFVFWLLVSIVGVVLQLGLRSIVKLAGAD